MTSLDEQDIFFASSTAGDGRVAVKELAGRIHQNRMALIVLFCSADYDLDAVSAACRECFADVPVIGCTGAGGIGTEGYFDRGMVAISFSEGAIVPVTKHLDQLDHFSVRACRDAVSNMVVELKRTTPEASAQNCFAMLLIDGVSMREEIVARTVQEALGEISLFGGSAGDDLRFERTFVLHGGDFHDNSAVLLLAYTPHPFKVFKTQHFIASDKKLMVTAAIPETRTVTKINGLPAGREYARVMGVEVDKLSPMIFAEHPVIVLVGDSEYVRSIQKINEDESLTFLCAIDEGIVLTVAQGVNFSRNLEEAFNAVKLEIGEPQVIFACDCILRNLELKQKGMRDSVLKILQTNNVVGFSTFGEQFGGMHVNQTLTALAIGHG
jgi:hypothetical protein